MLRLGKQQTGFTLIELMVAIAIAAIFLAVAVPSFQHSILNNRISTELHQLYTYLTFARAEAVNRGTTVTACSSSDQASCAASTNWATGWIVFIDSDGDGAVDGGETLLKAQQAISGSSALTYVANFVRFDSQGATADTGTFTLCGDGTNDTYAKELRVSATGRAVRDAGDC